NYQSYVSLYSQDQYWEYFGTFEYIDHPESGYLKILIEIGLIGFMVALIFLIKPLISAVIRLCTKVNENQTPLFLIAAITSWMVAFLTVYSFGDIRIFSMVVTLVCMLIVLNNPIKQDYEV